MCSRRVEPLERLAGDQDGRVEPLGRCLALAQVALDLGAPAIAAVASQAMLDHLLAGRLTRAVE